MLYKTLEETKSEVRLITLLPRSFEREIVRCTLNSYSLASLSQPYLKFLNSTEISNLSRRKIIHNWVQQNGDFDLDHRVYHDNPPEQFYRYTWGDYAALSYVWGDETQLTSIIVNGQTTKITQNLERALRTFRDQGEFVTGMKLWLDAICINQGDLEERGKQVKRMRDIYGGALTVISWLGVTADNSGKAIDLLQNLAGFHRMNHGSNLEKSLQQNPRYLGQDCWLALQRFVERSYWYRLWVIQEIVMGASAISMRCGTSSIAWTSLVDGITLLQEHLWIVKDLCLELEMQDKLLDFGGWSTPSLHLIYQDLALLCNREDKSGTRLGLGRILDLAVRSSCKDARDKVYGLIGLMDPRIASQIDPDYSMEVPQVYAMTAKAFIQGNQNLEPLREGNPWGPSGCPSWAPDWQWAGRIRWSRIENAVSRSGWIPKRLLKEFESSDPGRLLSVTPYHASGNSLYQAYFSNDNLLLTCGGFIVDSVSSLSAREYGYFAWKAATMVNNVPFKTPYGEPEHLSEALYRTLLLDRTWSGGRAEPRHASVFHLPSTFHAAEPQFKRRRWNWLAAQEGYYFRYELWRAANRGFFIGERKLDEFFTDHIPDDASEEATAESYSCIDRSGKKRRLMTTQKGYIGWAPDNMYGSDDDQTKHGDLIVILFGCSTPIVIRPKGNHFLLIGEAYVHGLMEGEAMDTFRRLGLKSQAFTFC